MPKGWTLVKRDLFLVRWWLVALAILLLGDVAVRFVEGLRPASDFWWEMLGHVHVWTVRLALGIWFGLVVFLFQEDRMDGKPAFWQARPTSVLRLVWGKVISVGLLLSAFWILLSVIDGSWSFRWTCGPMALAGVAAVVSVLSPGWRRLAIGLAGVGSLVWLGGVAWPWLLRFLGPGSAHGERAFFEMWLLAGLGAWGTLVVYVTMKRPMLAWAALVMSLGGAWFALASLRPGEATMGEDFGDEELTGEIELLFDPSARGDVERKLSGGVFVVDISRRAELVGVPLGVSVRARLEDAALSTDGGLRFSGNASFLKTLDRTPELFTNYRFSKAEPKDDEPDLLISGEGADMLPFINQLCDYRAEAVVELWKPENVHSFPFGSAGAWRDDEVAIRVETAGGRVASSTRSMRRTCLPRTERRTTLKLLLVSHGRLRVSVLNHMDARMPEEEAEVVVVRSRMIARHRMPVESRGLYVGDSDEPLEDIVIPKNPTKEQVDSLIARIANADGGGKEFYLRAFGPEHLTAVLRAGRASQDESFRRACRLACHQMAEERHREVIVKYNTMSFDLSGVIIGRGWLDDDALERMMKEAEAFPWQRLPDRWIEALAGLTYQRERALRLLGERLARSFDPKANYGFVSGPLLYKVLQEIDGFPLRETVGRGWKVHQPGRFWRATGMPLLGIGVEQGMPGALFRAALFLESSEVTDVGLALPELGVLGHVGGSGLSSKEQERQKFKDLVLDSCDFPPEAEFDELFWIKENAENLLYDKDLGKWVLPER